MFIRARNYTLKSGQPRQGFALIESRRIDGKPKHITLLNLGQDFNIPEEDWPELTRLVISRLKGQTCSPFQDEKPAQSVVEDIVNRLQHKGYDIYAEPDDRDAIITRKLHHTGARTVGGERLALKALELLGMANLLRTLAFPEKQVKLACAMIVGRMLAPGSERHTHQWMTHTSSILELLGLDTPSLSTLYRCADRLHKHRHAIMDRLYGHTKTLLGFDETIVFYDLTNTFYHGREKGELLRYGRSKQKRSDCPLVTLALTLDASGFPRRVEILPGNASEPGTLKQAIDNLNGETPTIIMDAGIATKENLEYMRETHLNWISVERTKAPPVPTKAPDQQFETASGVNVKTWSLAEENEELRVYVHSDARQATEAQILQKKCNQFEEKLEHLDEGLSVPGRLKNYDKVLVKVGRLREKYKQVAHLYEINVTKKEESPHAESVTVTKRLSHEKRTLASGGYVLRTSHTQWSAETVRFRLNQIHRITTVLPKSNQRYLITSVDQNLPPFLRRVVWSLRLTYDPDVTRIVEAYSDQQSASASKGPPNP